MLLRDCLWELKSVFFFFLSVSAGPRRTPCKDMSVLQGGPPPFSQLPDIDARIAWIYRLCYNVKLHTATPQCETNVSVRVCVWRQVHFIHRQHKYHQRQRALCVVSLHATPFLDSNLKPIDDCRDRSLILNDVIAK